MTKRAETKEKKALKFCSIEQELLVVRIRFISHCLRSGLVGGGGQMYFRFQSTLRYRHAGFLLAFHSSTM